MKTTMTCSMICSKTSPSKCAVTCHGIRPSRYNRGRAATTMRLAACRLRQQTRQDFTDGAWVPLAIPAMCFILAALGALL